MRQKDLLSPGSHLPLLFDSTLIYSPICVPPAPLYHRRRVEGEGAKIDCKCHFYSWLLRNIFQLGEGQNCEFAESSDAHYSPSLQISAIFRATRLKGCVRKTYQERHFRWCEAVCHLCRRPSEALASLRRGKQELWPHLRPPKQTLLAFPYQWTEEHCLH